MYKTILKTTAATILFALIHSALASRQAKARAAQLLGERHRNGLYRVFYIVQSAFTLGALGLYLLRLPDRVLYRVGGLPARLMNLGQLAGLLLAVYAAREVGMARITGLASLGAWLRADPATPPEPEAQGPAEDAGAMRATGPFRWTRHPLNLAPLPVFWLMPVMTVRLAAFNLVALAYFLLGSLHEESRLRAAYGSIYEDYQRSGVPFYFPAPTQLPPSLIP